MLFEHPETGIMYRPCEAAKIIGIHVATLYNRMRHGDTGKHLWRAKEQQVFKSKLPSGKLEFRHTQILRQIPSETKYEKE